MIIGITGAMGAGKSTVSAYLKTKGYPVFDTDRFAHEYYAQNGILYGWLIANFDNVILNDDGTVNRSKLSEIVFQNPVKLDLLESAVFRAVREDIKRISANADGLVFFEVPLLFEADMADLFDVILCIDMDRTLRNEHLLKRGLSHDTIESREARQYNIQVKRDLSDFVIENNDDLPSLYKKIDIILGRLRNG